MTGIPGTARRDQGVYMGDKLNDFYLSSLDGMPRLRESLKMIQNEVKEKGSTELQSLDREIELNMIVLHETIQAMGRISEDHPDRERLLRSARKEITHHIEANRRLKETNNEFYHGQKYAVRLDQLDNFLKVLMQILMSRVRDPDTLKKISKDINELCGTSFKSDVMRGAKEIEVRNENNSESGVGQGSEVAVADDNRPAADSGSGGDAGVQIPAESPGTEDEGDRPATDQG